MNSGTRTSPAHPSLWLVVPLFAYLLGFAFDQWLAQVTREPVVQVERHALRQIDCSEFYANRIPRDMATCLGWK